MTVFEQVKSAIDMRTVAEGYGLEISRVGMALCPFHNERTPSAKIYPDALDKDRIVRYNAKYRDMP